MLNDSASIKGKKKNLKQKDSSIKKIKVINGDIEGCELNSSLHYNFSNTQKEKAKDIKQTNGKTNQSTEKPKEQEKTKKNQNEFYSTVVNTTVNELIITELNKQNSLFVFPHNKNVIDLQKAINSGMNLGNSNLNLEKEPKKKINEHSIKKIRKEPPAPKKIQCHQEMAQSHVLNKTTENLHDRSFHIKGSFSDYHAQEYLVELNSCSDRNVYMRTTNSKDDSSNINDTNKNTELSHTQKNINSRRINSSMKLLQNKKSNTMQQSGKTHDDTLKEDDMPMSLKDDSVESNNDKGTHKKEKIKESTDEANNSVAYDTNHKNEHVKKGKIKNDNEKREIKNSMEQEYVTYKVPKHLRKKNITCPFLYKKVFFGKHGIINYDLKETESDILVITFHGLNGTNITFAEIQNILVQYQFQVLNFDLYGYGLSACPKYNHKKKTYGLEFFVSQTEELLQFLNLKHKQFYLIGFSMGCVIAAAFAKKYITQVKKIVFISPVGMLEKKPFLLKVLKKCPCLIKCSSYFVFPCFISKKKIQRSNKQLDCSDYLYNRLMWQLFVKKNITHSILGCLNNLKIWSAHELFKEVGMSTVPVLIICGNKDHICTANVFQNINKCFTNSHLITFENASHLIFVDKQLELIACVLTFFHFPLDNVDMDIYHYMLPIDQNGSYVVQEKRFPPKYNSFKSFLEDVDYIPNICISFIDKEKEHIQKKVNQSIAL